MEDVNEKPNEEDLKDNEAVIVNVPDPNVIHCWTCSALITHEVQNLKQNQFARDERTLASKIYPTSSRLPGSSDKMLCGACNKELVGNKVIASLVTKVYKLSERINEIAGRG